ncbi:unnamed protein product [Clonostachys rhizophaga]|uniref:O-methyltransferase n=1 Tax=Clonostachys rhizophaga TaxID=160324 RepID=A0A9N9YKL9_9HYPO|nr:unnamed protein product [Clonostachys rhizophaga]
MSADNLKAGDSIDFESMKASINFDNFLSAGAIDTKAQALLRPNSKLEHALTNSAAKGLPPISVLPLAGQYLSILTKLIGAKNVLEIGTLGGYSSIRFAEAGAKVTSVEMNLKHHEVAVENVQGLDVDVILGSALEVLPKLAEEGRKFDLVFIDADWDHHWEYFDWAVKLTRPNGCVYLDDVIPPLFKSGKVEDEAASVFTKIGQDERVEATLVPLVATHPLVPTPVFNGYVLARVKE